MRKKEQGAQRLAGATSWTQPPRTGTQQERETAMGREKGEGRGKPVWRVLWSER